MNTPMNDLDRATRALVHTVPRDPNVPAARDPRSTAELVAMYAHDPDAPEAGVALGVIHFRGGVEEFNAAKAMSESLSAQDRMADLFALVAHLNPRYTTLAFVSRAPQENIQRLKAEMGWEMPWYSLTDDFDADFGVGEWHGTNAFYRDDDDQIFRTYFIDNRGDEAMGSTWAYLDITALGRQELWENSPEGYPQTPPYQWWNYHDAYGEES